MRSCTFLLFLFLFLLLDFKWETSCGNAWQNTASFLHFVPPIVARESDEPRKPAGGLMVTSDDNTDIVHPILRPDRDEQDLHEYERIATYLERDPSHEGQIDLHAIHELQPVWLPTIDSGSGGNCKHLPNVLFLFHIVQIQDLFFSLHFLGPCHLNLV